MKISKIVAGALVGAMTYSFAASGAFAGSVTQPGETVGFDAATPLPEGVYFESTQSIGNRQAGWGGYNQEGVGIPLIAWSTPWTLLGGRFVVLAATPALYLGTHPRYASGSFDSGWYNPFLAATLQWNLGNGISAAYLAGVYIPISGGDFQDAFNQTTFRQDLSLAYHKDGWNAIANLIFGIVGNNGGHSVYSPYNRNPDYFNYDLSLTHTFGKWEVGPVAFGSTDVGSPYNGYKMQSQFALGGLVGYNFGPVITQFYLTRDVAEQNYTGYETRAWMRVVVPLWNPAPAAVAAKY